MKNQIDIDQVWWRNVQMGEFYNIEREPKIEGGGGSLYIEIPSSMVNVTLEFLGANAASLQDGTPLQITAKVYEDPTISGVIEFHTKKGNRMRIARQNRKQKNSLRHPAWMHSRGFPKAPDGLPNLREAYAPYYPEGGLRIYILKSTSGEFFAGFTTGPRPPGMEPDDPNSVLYPDNSRMPGGVFSLPKES
ncbi:hypothetical protein HMPREF2657_08950 [Corynebacterium sp. HMSC072B08]|uniref:hypothetical protein n=1 Tax=Corynebacterium sp. HMSC072B08 TaxID=1715136 RepID=UPI000910E676|nr:hypothetical protein [Corynebacterium sp. HMSC072B08]OHQ62339.1 hypothetical protein HMPREF2657_08950 [Corynebacterium sp. HMSC072B08]